MTFHIESIKYKELHSLGNMVDLVIFIARTRNIVYRLSTVKLPGNYGYETCYFRNKAADVMERYDTESEAIIGHHKWMKEYGFDSLSYST